VIPDEAVEAAAKVLYVEDYLFAAPWEDATATRKDEYRTRALIAIDAAAPHVLARHEAALEAISKALSDAVAFGRVATHIEVMEAMRSELTK